MKKLIVNTIFVFVFASLIIPGCKKEQNDNDTTAASDNAQAENIYDDASGSVDDAAKGNKYLDPTATGILTTTCPTISIDHPDSTTWPKVVTIDFGTTNCTNASGVARRGQIIATFSGPYRANGTVISITFNNYYVNDNHVEGTKTITNGGTNSLGQMFWTVVVQNAQITKTDGSFLNWSATRTRTWVAGQNTTGNWADDAYEITGSAAGSNSSGGTYTSTITSPLYLSWGCRWIEAGTMEVTPSGKPLRTIDFGTAGSCDNDATVTINGKVYNIILKN
jgi:hypothetical protein